MEKKDGSHTIVIFFFFEKGQPSREDPECDPCVFRGMLVVTEMYIVLSELSW